MQSTNIHPTAIFVYGTLKRGQSREPCWPRKPFSIDAATVQGTLYDLGPYPGLTPGSDTITGELWQFDPADIPPTLAALDEIEDYQGRNDDEYRRVIIQCALEEKSLEAWTYHYARTAALTAAQRIQPNHNGLCQWHARLP